MRIAITGATGFIGSALSKYLSIFEHDIVEYVRGPNKSNQVEINLSWNSLPKDYLKDIDVLIHCAASVHKKNKTEDILFQNVTFTELLINSAIENSVKGLYFISTVGVFGKDSFDSPMSDSSELDPQNDYSRSKLEAERIVISKCSCNDIPFNIIRLPLVLGRNAPGTFGTLLKAIEKRLPFPFKGVNNKRSILRVDDLVRCIGYMLENDIYINDSGVMCQSKSLSISEIILQGGEFLSKKVLLFYFPKITFEILLSSLMQRKVYNQLFESLEFFPHPEFKKVFESR